MWSLEAVAIALAKAKSASGFGVPQPSIGRVLIFLLPVSAVRCAQVRMVQNLVYATPVHNELILPDSQLGSKFQRSRYMAQAASCTACEGATRYATAIISFAACDMNMLNPWT